jgi:hypothetical protein
MLTIEQILSALDSPVAMVTVPEWGGDIYMKFLSAMDREKWEIEVKRMFDDNTQKKPNHIPVSIRASLLQKSICDENGKLLFAEADIPSLSNKSGPVIMRLFDECRRINAMDLTGEEIRKN